MITMALEVFFALFIICIAVALIGAIFSVAWALVKLLLFVGVVGLIVFGIVYLIDKIKTENDNVEKADKKISDLEYVEKHKK